ncbi:MAG: hypothetical protein HY319_14525 [Armatimonadetes bacterium]|nr:hypothetical protein [Armatimonadota bacterium]
MRPNIELDIDRQTLRPGDELSGVLSVSGVGQHRGFSLSLQGEEVLGADNIVRSYVLPVLDEKLVALEGGDPAIAEPHPFFFLLPADTPPSYSSQEFRCQYCLKARVRSGWRDTIQRYHLTILPPQTAEEAQPEDGAHELVLEEEQLKLTARLERTSIPTGGRMAGTLVLSRTGESAPPPGRLTFRFAAIEEATEPGYYYRKVLWLGTHEVQPEPEAEFPIGGYFEFALPDDAPFSGEWNTFKVHYGFRVGMILPSGRHVRQSLPIRVYRVYSPERPLARPRRRV